MTGIGPFKGKASRHLDTITPPLKNRAKPFAQVERHSWAKTLMIDLRSARIAVLKAPRIPTLADRMERFLAKLSQGTAAEASRALNELAMMVTAEAIDRGMPAAKILTPIAIKIVGRWSIDQFRHERTKLLEHRNSMAGGKTREAVVNLLVDLFDEKLRFHAELGKHFETLARI
jgi:hypothetical protein